MQATTGPGRLFAALLMALLPQGARSQPAPAPGEPLSLQAFRACVDQEAQLRVDAEKLEARGAQLQSEGDAMNVEVAKIAEAQQSPNSASRTAQEALARRIDIHNARVRAADAAVAELNQQADRHAAAVAALNAACANRPVNPKDRDAVLAEQRAKAASPVPSPPRQQPGPFEEGVAAYDAGRFDRAFALWAPLAEQGHVPAQFNLGTLYELGQGVARNDATAAAWFVRAAERGDVQAQVKLAGWYESGTGVARDPARARFWYEAVLVRPDPQRDSAALKQHARERLASLAREWASQSVLAIAYDGGRFVILKYGPGACVVALQGGVTASASYMFEEAIKKAAASGCNSPAVLLESLGGTLLDGLSLGQSIRGAGLKTIARAECASACALIFLGGVERMLLGPQARIGFHQAAVLVGRDQRRHCDPSNFSPEMRKVRAYLRFATADNADRIFGLMMQTSCDSIAWVEGQGAIELGVATRIDAGTDFFWPNASPAR